MTVWRYVSIWLFFSQFLLKFRLHLNEILAVTVSHIDVFRNSCKNLALDSLIDIQICLFPSNPSLNPSPFLRTNCYFSSAADFHYSGSPARGSLGRYLLSPGRVYINECCVNVIKVHSVGPVDVSEAGRGCQLPSPTSEGKDRAA